MRGVQFGAWWVEADAEYTKAGERVSRPLPLIRDGLTCAKCDFDGADELGRVVGVDELCGGGVEAGEDAMQMCGTFFSGARAEFFAERFVALRRGEEAVEERAEIEAGASGDDGQASALRDAGDGFAGEAAVVSGGAGLVWGEDVDEVVGDAFALGECGLGGADLHAAVDGD